VPGFKSKLEYLQKYTAVVHHQDEGRSRVEDLSLETNEIKKLGVLIDNDFKIILKMETSMIKVTQLLN